VMPPPMLPQPAAMALAEPTTLVLNMDVHQNWQHTKAAREKPINRRAMMKPMPPAAQQQPGTTAISSTAGQHSRLLDQWCLGHLRSKRHQHPHLLQLPTGLMHELLCCTGLAVSSYI
jgi:hypothetical protein